MAIAIGLFGVAASFSAQVLARRKEFGLLAHLGLTRRQILAVVAAEGRGLDGRGRRRRPAAGPGRGGGAGACGEPQSFHWSMDLALPWARWARLPPPSWPWAR